MIFIRCWAAGSASSDVTTTISVAIRGAPQTGLGLLDVMKSVFQNVPFSSTPNPNVLFINEQKYIVHALKPLLNM